MIHVIVIDADGILTDCKSWAEFDAFDTLAAERFFCDQIQILDPTVIDKTVLDEFLDEGYYQHEGRGGVFITHNKLEHGIVCTHPDHVDGQSCEEGAIGCDAKCVCCQGQITDPEFSPKNYKELKDAVDKEDQIWRKAGF